MAAFQKVAIQKTLDSPALSPEFGSPTSGNLQEPLKDNSDNLRRNLKYHNKKPQAFNRQNSSNSDDRPEKTGVAKNTCPRIAYNQRSQCSISNEEDKVKYLQTEQSASTEKDSLLHCFHSLQEKSLHSSNLEGMKDQSSVTHNKVKQSNPEHAGAHQQQIDSDIVDYVIGDELGVKASSGHHPCSDAAESAALVKQLPHLSQDSEKLPDAATGGTFCASHSDPRRSPSQHFLRESHNETKSQLQPVSCSKGLKLLSSTQIESVVSRFSTSSSSSSSSSLVEDRTLGSEQISHFVDPNNPCRHSIPQTNVHMPNNAEATEVGVTQDSHVALLRTLLAEKDEDLNQLSEELKQLQHINKQLLEEQCLVLSANKRLQKETIKALEGKVNGDESETDYLAYNPTAPAMLQQRIEDLKSHLKDLQEANDNAVNELTKADEEISQLRGEIAKLRTKHAEELQDAKQECDYFKDKDTTFDLLEEIQQLRNESRKLREANHRLDEETRQLKEVLWDFKRQREWLSKKRFKGKMGNIEMTKGGDDAISTQKGELPKKDEETVLQKKSSFPSQLQCVSPSSQLRFEYFNIEEKSGPTKSSEGVNSFDQRLQSWDDEDKDRGTSRASPVSVDSDSTEALIASCNNEAFGQASNSKKHHLGGSLLDLDGLSDDDMSSKSQINGRHQFPYTHCSSSTPCKSRPSSSGFWSSSLNIKNPVRSIVNKAVLPRRPFAPRGIVDLRIGHLVKFSRPAGKISKGVIKYLGHLPGRQEAYLGIELEGNEVGQHNGTFEGVRYFICKLNKGVFVNFSKVIMAWE